MFDFAELIERAYVDERVAKTTGNKYNMLVLEIQGGVKFEYICTRGEDNVVTMLGELHPTK